MKIGFAELLVILVVAFFVLGPERLPVYARKAGSLLNRLKGYSSRLTEEINRNIVEPVEDVTRPLQQAADPLSGMKKTLDEVKKPLKKPGQMTGGK